MNFIVHVHIQCGHFLFQSIYYDNIAHINHTTMTLRPKVITEIGNAIQRIKKSRDNVSKI